MKAFPALHLFLDESGKLEGLPRAKEVALVGGVLILGEYTPEDDRHLIDGFHREMAAAGGSFPHDLHHGTQKLSANQWKTFLQGTKAFVRSWAETGRSIYTVAIRHEADLYAGGPALLREAAYDNRYVSMLWALLEHLLFVDDRISDRLAPDATIHLHLASRMNVFFEREVPRAELEALGYHVRPGSNSRDGKYVVPCSLRPDELRGMFRIALRRWTGSQRRLEEIDIQSLDYARGSSPAALYLADLVLGQVRQRLLSKVRPGYHPAVRVAPLDELCLLDYGPELQAQADQQAALLAGNLDSYLETLGEETGPSRGQKKRALELAQESPARVLAALEEACEEVDWPGRAARSIKRAEATIQLLRSAGANHLRAELLYLQARLSRANHLGDVTAAQAIWQEYQALEPRLAELGEEGLRLKTELRTRRAVGLMDRFDFDAAAQTMIELGTTQSQLHENLARQFQLPPERIPSRLLGICFSALAQALAFRGGDGDSLGAENGFRAALQFFAEKVDQDRIWIYLGHLACDRGEAGRSLWHEVVQARPELAPTQPLGEADRQYSLALQLKGLLVFGGQPDRANYLNLWQTKSPMDEFDSEARAAHPFGLIEQTLGMLFVQHGRETKDAKALSQARGHFQSAMALFDRGGALLKALGLVCRMRHQLAEREFQPNEGKVETQLAHSCRLFETQLQESFGDHAWGRSGSGTSFGYFGRQIPHDDAPAHERASALVGAVRFNYW